MADRIIVMRARKGANKGRRIRLKVRYRPELVATYRMLIELGLVPR